MSHRLFALLVGINDYPPGIRSLLGCVNDVRGMEAFLQGIVSAEWNIDGHVLLNDCATRTAVIQGFRNHLSQAGKDDAVLFYFCGHGSRGVAPVLNDDIPNGEMMETLVCYDSRQPGSWDLTDKEMACLIAEIAVHDSHILVILDCCHAGSGTRDEGGGGAVEVNDPECMTLGAVREIGRDHRTRPLNTYLYNTGHDVRSFVIGASGGRDHWIPVHGRHILLAACHPHQRARECFIDHRFHGLFSWFLLDTLRKAGGATTYHTFIKRIQGLVNSRFVDQMPHIEAVDHDLLDQRLFGGGIQTRLRLFTLRHHESGWVVDGGALHGIRADNGSPCVFAILPYGATIAAGDLKSTTIGTASATSVRPHECSVDLNIHTGLLHEKEMYSAVIVHQSGFRLNVALMGDDAGCRRIRHALATAGPLGTGALHVEERAIDEATCVAEALPGAYTIRSAPTSSPCALIEGVDEFAAGLVVEGLEHIARWKRLASLVGRDGPSNGFVQLLLLVNPAFRSDALPNDSWEMPIGVDHVRLRYLHVDGEWIRPSMRVMVTNISTFPLYCMLLALSDTYAITSEMLPGGGTWLAPGESIMADDGRPVPFDVRANADSAEDVLKLVVTTGDCDATLLDQESLAERINYRTALRTSTGVDAGVKTRAFGSVRGDEHKDSWWTQDLLITTTRAD
ncbi:MAG: caspase family protein [Bacteroidetes bacterium]|nr:caspase family protein [Bacteroidota bacterium]